MARYRPLTPEHGLSALVGHRFVQQAEALRAHDWTEMNDKLYGFLDRLAAASAH